MTSWPQAPAPWLFTPGLYMVTAGTYEKRPFFDTLQQRDALMEDLLTGTTEFGWQLHAWSVFANHYHFVARSPEDAASLARMLSKLHTTSALRLNREQGTPGRKVWFQYWDSQLTFERSYFARLHYVHENPVKHGVVLDAENYPWCSAAWFAENATAAFRRTIQRFKCERVNVPDDF